jgi:hypothetical protein
MRAERLFSCCFYCTQAARQESPAVVEMARAFLNGLRRRSLFLRMRRMRAAAKYAPDLM